MTTCILVGDVLARLRKLPSNSVDCCVTSPPYWGLRSYIDDDKPEKRFEIGLEPTLGEHIAVLVEVFREVRRVLKAHGTCWLNYGDCYAAAPNGKSAAAYKADGTDDRTFRDKPFSTVGPIYQPGHSKERGQRGDATRKRAPEMPGGRVVAGGFLKPKDLCMIPNRLAIALQDDGWYVRSEIIWHKPNPMPESVYDRPTSAHEKVWLLSKSEDYFYNHEAIREPVTAARRAPGPNSRQHVDRVPVSRKVKVPGGWDTATGAHGTIHRTGRTEAEYADAAVSDTKNARNVWTIAPRPFREAHFATFPPALAERCIKAGVPTTVCGCCGAAEGCGPICETFDRVPGVVLDPFGGAGTVGLVADQLGVDALLIELNPEYVEIIERRLGLGDAIEDEAA
ncbi:site-specific DNA-methyltransferase [Nostoc ellipsosporum NOK]|nr:site-specific DNA-methyltransferase [Nostoc ellipsosporum NOK]